MSRFTEAPCTESRAHVLSGILLDNNYHVTLHPSFCEEEMVKNFNYNKDTSNGLKNFLLSNRHNNALENYEPSKCQRDGQKFKVPEFPQNIVQSSMSLSKARSS